MELDYISFPYVYFLYKNRRVTTIIIIIILKEKQEL